MVWEKVKIKRRYNSSVEIIKNIVVYKIPRSICSLKMTRKEQILIETRILKKLNKNFECICCKKRKHFPKYYDTVYDKEKYKGILMSYCGESLNEVKCDIKDIKDIKEQIDCIIHNLKKNKIGIFDINSGNITIKDGDIYVIDYGRAYVEDDELDKLIKNKYIKDLFKCVCNNYYKRNSEKILDLIRKSLPGST